MNVVQHIMFKKFKTISALRHIQLQLSQREKKRCCVVNISSFTINEKTTNDGKEKPQIIKLFDFTKGGTNSVNQLNDFYTTRAKSC